MKGQIALDFQEGVDRKALKALRDRFLEIHADRLKKGLLGLAPRQQDVLQILPLLYHVDHPTMPGFVDRQTPFGVRGYLPGKEITHIAKRFSPAFSGPKKATLEAPILAVYAMGSTGSIAQSERSDVDLWVCFDPSLGQEDLLRLRRKAAAIDHWAMTQGLELHTFLINPESFKDKDHSDSVHEESSGSMQPSLILDEFYRTSIWLAGAYPLWWLIPCDHEKRYTEWANFLLEKRFVRASEYIDFGSPTPFPTSELCKAGMWQIYKSLNSPYKSFLKLLLIESYIRADRQDLCLSQVFKQIVHRGAYQLDDMDAYVLLAQFLQQKLDDSQLQRKQLLFQKSLYIKVGASLNLKKVKGWRSHIVYKLVRNWHWPDRLVAELNARPLWRVETVRRERSEMIRELNLSYRYIVSMGRGLGFYTDVSQGDESMLGKRLYSVFHQQAGKIERINMGFAPTLIEDQLVFVHGSVFDSEALSSRTGSYWFVFRSQRYAGSLDPKRDAIHYDSDISALLLWLAVNGVLESNLRVGLDSGTHHLTMNVLRSLVEVTLDFVKFRLNDPPLELFRRPPKPKRLVIVLNLEIDPQATDHEKGLHRLSAWNNALSYSSERKNLFGSADLLILNTWGEFSHQSIQYGESIFQTIKLFLEQLVDSDQMTLETSVECFAEHNAAAMRFRIEQLFEELKVVAERSKTVSIVRYVFELHGELAIVNLREGDVQCYGVPSEIEFLEMLGQAQRAPTLHIFDDNVLSGFTEIKQACGLFQTGEINCVLEVVGHDIHAAITDETGACRSFVVADVDFEDVLSDLAYFGEQLKQQRALDRNAFNHEDMKFWQSVGDGELRAIYPQRVGELDAHPEKLEVVIDTSQTVPEFEILWAGHRLVGEQPFEELLSLAQVDMGRRCAEVSAFLIDRVHLGNHLSRQVSFVDYYAAKFEAQRRLRRAQNEWHLSG